MKNKNSSFLLSILIGGGLCSIFPKVTNAAIIGVEFDGDVYSINEGDGVGTFLGASGFSDLNGAASNSSGTIYSASESSLITINPLNGLGTLETTINGGDIFNGIRGLAFSPADVLYAVIDTGALGSLGSDSLYTIDVDTGAISLVGATGSTSLQGLAFSSGGELFAWDVDLGLVEVNVGNGSLTDLPGPGSETNSIQALEFASDGTLLGGRSSLFNLNSTTGAFDLIGSGGGYSDIRGLADSRPIPEPLTILGTATALGFGVLFKKKKLSSKTQ